MQKISVSPRITQARRTIFQQIFFYHPDYTVGKGISPFREEKQYKSKLLFSKPNVILDKLSSFPSSQTILPVWIYTIPQRKFIIILLFITLYAIS